ncbi:hypothetical protein [Neobacillus sp. PS3-40]|jgi:predicted transcriptional regulator|uniref:hypothetical protein n=1 Tax=Neobacillus sp. PS3-40 TaxID=3070679 RepID=UPI0027E05907|nr:hypothetical protein [Neobacillus sp. PS3-40]WML43993.1 hypothetical protein RCG20_19775 [Neobacillus sp. PS3-40]
MNNKDKLMKNFQKMNQGNFFTIEIPTVTEKDKSTIEEWVKELEHEGKIKVRECISRENAVYLHGIIKYASE